MTISNESRVMAAAKKYDRSNAENEAEFQSRLAACVPSDTKTAINFPVSGEQRSQARNRRLTALLAVMLDEAFQEIAVLRAELKPSQPDAPPQALEMMSYEELQIEATRLGIKGGRKKREDLMAELAVARNT